MKKSMDKLINSTCFFKLYQEEFDDDLLDELRKY